MAELGVPPDASFASDNAAGVHPAVMDALVAANSGAALAYGSDPWTHRAVDRFRDLFDTPVEVAMCWGGTGANVVGLQCLLRPGDAVICPDGAHINVDECGAPERFTGAKLIDLPCPDGKLRPAQIHAACAGLGDEHHAQPRVVSITQSTEYGTLYSPDEIGALADVAHRHGLFLHLDGARIANAAAALDVPVAAFTTEVGVDVITFGGTKGGMMYGEAVVFCRPELGERVRFVRKQAGQLPSKMRYVSAQFEAYLTDDLWLRNARAANAAATDLAAAVGDIEGVTITQPPAVNAVFATLPHHAREALQAWSFFWDWDAANDEVRWMTSFSTTAEDVERFASGVRRAVAAHP